MAEKDVERVTLKDDEESVRTVNARKALRTRLESDIEVYLKQGGAIQQIDVNVMADPPTKPSTKYGGRPI